MLILSREVRTCSARVHGYFIQRTTAPFQARCTLVKASRTAPFKVSLLVGCKAVLRTNLLHKLILDVGVLLHQLLHSAVCDAGLHDSLHLSRTADLWCIRKPFRKEALQQTASSSK